jgi:hypothetical protein
MLIQINTAALALSEVEATLAARCAVSLVVQFSSLLVVASHVHPSSPRLAIMSPSGSLDGTVLALHAQHCAAPVALDR